MSEQYSTPSSTGYCNMPPLVTSVILQVFHFEKTHIGKTVEDAANTKMEGNAMSNVRGTEKSFHPEAAHAMGMAFDSAWQDLEASGNIFSPHCTKDWARKTIAARIIDTADRGERDPDRLSNDALAYLAHLLAPMPDQWPAIVANRSH